MRPNHATKMLNAKVYVQDAPPQSSI